MTIKSPAGAVPDPEATLAAAFIEANARLDAMDARARRHFTPCGQGTLIWRVWGSGPPLIMLHGGQGYWAHWFHTIEALGATRSLWIPDLPGFGDSALPAANDHAAFVAPVAKGIAELIGPEPVDVLGFSFGGVLATHLASLHPDQVRRVVVVNPGGLGTRAGNVTLHRVRDLEGAAWEDAVRANMLSLMFHDPANADALAMTIYRNGMRNARANPAPLVIPDHLLRALARTDTQLDAIWGALDRAHPVDAGQEAALRGLRPSMRFDVVPDAGHWCMFENATAFNRIALDMLG